MGRRYSKRSHLASRDTGVSPWTEDQEGGSSDQNFVPRCCLVQKTAASPRSHGASLISEGVCKEKKEAVDGSEWSTEAVTKLPSALGMCPTASLRGRGTGQLCSFQTCGSLCPWKEARNTSVPQLIRSTFLNWDTGMCGWGADLCMGLKDSRRQTVACTHSVLYVCVFRSSFDPWLVVWKITYPLWVEIFCQCHRYDNDHK